METDMETKMKAEKMMTRWQTPTWPTKPKLFLIWPFAGVSLPPNTEIWKTTPWGPYCQYDRKLGTGSSGRGRYNLRAPVSAWLWLHGEMVVGPRVTPGGELGPSHSHTSEDGGPLWNVAVGKGIDLETCQLSCQIEYGMWRVRGVKDDLGFLLEQLNVGATDGNADD